MIETNPRILDSLLGPNPKIVVATADRALAQDLLKDEGCLPASLQPVVFRPATATLTAKLHSLLEVGVESVPLSSLPAGHCVLAAFSETGKSELAELAAWWRDHCPDRVPKVLDLAVAAGTKHRIGLMSALYRELFELTQEELDRADCRIARLHGELYELRTEYEQARGVLKKIQDHGVQLSPFRLIEVLQPSAQVYPHSAEPTGCVRQWLPTSAAGLAAIDLYSPQSKEKTGEGDLLLVLQSRERATPLAAWRVAYDRLGHGWFRCAVPVALTAPVHQLELIVIWQTVRGIPPRLALSRVELSPEMRARVDETPLDGALALALWGTLPGTAIRIPTPGWSSTVGEPGDAWATEYALEARDIQRVRPTTKTSVSFLHPLGDVPGFRLHPLDRMAATALLPKACMARTDRLLATVQIRHPEAKSPVEYAMCLTDADAKCRKFPAIPEKDRSVVGFSGWQAIPVDQQPHTVSLVLDQPLARPADLHFATRMPGWHSTAYQWADWLEVRIRLRYGAFSRIELPTEKPVGAITSRTVEFVNPRADVIAAKTLNAMSDERDGSGGCRR